MDVNEEDRWFLNNITNCALAQAQRINSIFERREQEMNNQEMNTMTLNNQHNQEMNQSNESNEERTIEDLPPSYRSILRSNHSTANTTFEKQLIREIKEIKLRILDIFKILNRCEDNFLVSLSFCITISIFFAFFYLIYVYSSDPVNSFKTNSSTIDLEKNVFNDLEKNIFNN